MKTLQKANPSKWKKNQPGSIRRRYDGFSFCMWQ